MKARSLLALIAIGAGALLFHGVQIARAPRERAGPGTIERQAVARALVTPSDGVSEIRAQVAGRVLKVRVRIGDRVTQGDVLAEIDARALREEVARRRAEREALSAAVPPDGPRSVRDAARERVNAADAAVRRAEIDLGAAVLLAPRAGVVLARRLSEGDEVMSASPEPLFEIADTSRLELRLELEEDDSQGVTVGAPVHVRRPGRDEVLVQSSLTRLGPRLEARALGREDSRARASGMVRVGWVPLPENTPFAMGTSLEAVIGLSPRSVRARVRRTAVQIVDGRAMVRVPRTIFIEDRAVLLGDADRSFVELCDVEPGLAVLVTPE